MNWRLQTSFSPLRDLDPTQKVQRAACKAIYKIRKPTRTTNPKHCQRLVQYQACHPHDMHTQTPSQPYSIHTHYIHHRTSHVTSTTQPSSKSSQSTAIQATNTFISQPAIKYTSTSTTPTSRSTPCRRSRYKHIGDKAPPNHPLKGKKKQRQEPFAQSERQPSSQISAFSR